MKPKNVKVYAPATIANLGPGFDILGLAIDNPGDTVYASRQKIPRVSFSLKGKNKKVPHSVKRNVAAYVAKLMLDDLKPGFGIKILLDKHMPSSSGLGSSAASSVAAAVAVNALLVKPLPRKELLSYVIEGERLASGAAHADNVAPSLLGGVCLIRGYQPLDVIKLPVKNKFFWVVIHPHLMINTGQARRMLPKNISFKHAIQQWGNISGLTLALIKGDEKLLARCLQDIIVEPVRAKLIPGFAAVKNSALAAGALACSISGSGPSLFAITTTLDSANIIMATMITSFAANGIKADGYVSKINQRGAEYEIY